MPTKSILDHVEYWHNRASDTNFVWFPFLFLKIRPEILMTHKRTLIMTVCFSVYFNAVYVFKKLLFSEQVDILASQIYFTFGFASWFAIVTKTLWNRRAIRIGLEET